MVREREKSHRTRPELTNQYYDLVTDFYEYGWGQNFHFACRFPGEAFQESLARHEYYLAHALGLQRGQVCLDAGCGVGGPQRNIARFTGAKVVGLNNNEYQVKRALRLNAAAGLKNVTDVVKGDFMKLPFADAVFDHAYACEATCHAPNRVDCFQQILRVVKPGGCLALYEWGLTSKYEASNAEHKRIKIGIEEGNGIASLIPVQDIVQAVQKAGWELIRHEDLAETQVKEGGGYTVVWQQPLKGGWGNLRGTRMGRWCTHKMVTVLEAIRIAPKGTVNTSAMLMKTGDALTDGGDTGVFTPMYFILARKPSSSTSSSSSASPASSTTSSPSVSSASIPPNASSSTRGDTKTASSLPSASESPTTDSSTRSSATSE